VRKRIVGQPERPRLNVFRSARHIYAQIIDDSTGKTLLAASTLEKGMNESDCYTGNSDAAAKVGAVIAKRALDSGIKTVVFDRNGFLYHGRIKSLAEAARENGLSF
jgi:large subunit ribosomal protein L18